MVVYGDKPPNKNYSILYKSGVKGRGIHNQAIRFKNVRIESEG